MEQKQIDGNAIFFDNGAFTFDASYPKDKKVFAKEQKLRGTLTVEQNAYTTFHPYQRLPSTGPQRNYLVKNGNLRVEQTTRNFIVTMKFPIVQLPKETLASQKEMWKQADTAIHDARNEIKQNF